MVRQAGRRIEIMAAVGITPENAREIRDKTGVRDIHVGSGANASAPPLPPGGTFQGKAQRMVDADRVSRIVKTLKH
jgi:copper homeostasis protein CutC